MNTTTQGTPAPHKNPVIDLSIATAAMERVVTEGVQNLVRYGMSVPDVVALARKAAETTQK